MFVDALGGYNVVVGFCDSNDDPNKEPSEYPDLGYAPAVSCGGNTDSTCNIGQCQTSITIDSTDDDYKCDTFLASTYTTGGNCKFLIHTPSHIASV